MYLRANSQYLLLVLDGVSCCIKSAFSASMSWSNIISGFERKGIWCSEILNTSIEPLNDLFTSTDNDASINLKTLVDSFMGRGRSLIRDADVVMKVRCVSTLKAVRI